ncbi:ketopantoate reductase family protein [uncultured Phascolarctobacterium sp.]
MRQDALAKRPSEVELFAGTIIRLAAKHGLAVPVNQRYYERIKQIEAEY